MSKFACVTHTVGDKASVAYGMAEDVIQSAAEEELLEQDPRWQLARRIVRHPTLSRATQLRNILLYLTRQSILRPNESVDDYEIAHRVLGRRSDFDPMDDSIVRVQMAHLRKRLHHYFATDGHGEETIISIALGSYEPVFSRRLKTESAEPSSPKDDLPSENPMNGLEGFTFKVAVPLQDEASPARRDQETSFRWGAVACAAALLAGTFIGLHLRTAESLDGGVPEVSNPVLRQVFGAGTHVNVVLADTSLVALQIALRSDISIAEYLDPRYPDNVLAGTLDPVLRSQLTALTHSRYTSLNDADVVGRCSYWGSILGAKVDVRYARYMHVRDFQQENFVIVGSRRGNPWVSLFEPVLNFSLEQDPDSRIFHIKNRNPKPGELRSYEPASAPDGSSVGYVDIALLPNLGGTGSVLLLKRLYHRDERGGDEPYLQ